MVPVITRNHARSIEEFGELVRDAGEEFVYVIEGTIGVHTEFYDPVKLEAGESIYIDSGMGHVYVCADGCTEALTIGVMASADDDLPVINMSGRHELGAPESERRRTAKTRAGTVARRVIAGLQG